MFLVEPMCLRREVKGVYLDFRNLLSRSTDLNTTLDLDSLTISVFLRNRLLVLCHKISNIVRSLYYSYVRISPAPLYMNIL